MKQPHLRVPFYILASTLLVLAGVIYASVSAYVYLAPSLPDVTSIKDIRLQVPLRVYSRDGRLLAQFGEQRCIPLAFEAIPDRMVNALLAAEDDNFFQHSGVDYPGLLRAVGKNLISGEKGEGGSTITMQLTRGLFFTPEKSYRRKLLEIFLTLRIERELNKQEILALYLNKMFLGQRAYGVGAAAEVYFGKTVDRLSLPEMALIAGVFRLPSRDNPVANPQFARHRRAYVLRRMREKEFITQEEHDAAVNAPVESKLHGPAVQVEAPYVAEMARADALQKFGERIYTDGYKVITTVDSRLQHAANGALRLGLIEYDRRHGYRGPLAHVEIPSGHSAEQLAAWLEKYESVNVFEPALVTHVAERSARVVLRDGAELALEWEGLSWARRITEGGGMGALPKSAADVVQAGDIVYIVRTGTAAQMVQVPVAQSALVALDPRDGAIVALDGGFDYFTSNYNRAVQAKRQPGSAFKPFLYSAALEHGFTPASVVLDAPVVFEDDAAEDRWRPENSTREFYGPTRLREALVRSRNLVSVRLMRAMGIPFTLDYLTSHFGFPPEILPRDLTLALGSLQLAPVDLAAGFATFANGGFRIRPYYVERIEDAAGRTVYQSQPSIVCPECEDSLAPTPVASEQEPVTNPQNSFKIPPERVAPRAISAQNAYLLRDMMRDVIRRGTAKRASVLNRNDLAGKTGTTNDHHDAWFCGFNSNLVAAVWVGFDQEASLGAGEEGGRTAVPAWIQFMREALRGMPEAWPDAPDGLVTVKISPRTGKLAGAGDPDAIFETFIQDRQPEAADPFDRTPASTKEAASDEPLF